MFRLLSKRIMPAVLTLALAFFLTAAPRSEAADHGDAPIAGNNQSTDIADVFAFLDPNDNTRLILQLTQRGFISSGENANFGIFDQFLKYQLSLETTGDERPDLSINITFTEVEGPGGPQTATIELPFLPFNQSFTARTTVSSTAATAPAQVVTTDPGGSGVSFFAGLIDDPFFFDIPAFGRFLTSVRAGTPDPTQLQRGRDSFAGYNVMGIALSIPLSLLELDAAVSIIGVQGIILRQTTRVTRQGGLTTSGRFRQVERMGNPAVNVALVPFLLKDEFNFATPRDDADGQFATDIVNNLIGLGTSTANIDLLASIAVTNGDYLRLNRTIANSGPMGGNNPGAGFPNGRRLADDTVDTLLFIITNGVITTGDNANASDIPPANTFPFFALPQQPRAPGVIDDNTRN